MTTQVDICNKAIVRLGGNLLTSNDGTLTSVSGDSLELKLCRLNYEVIRDVVTEDRIWSFAISRAILDTPEVTKPLFGYGNQFLIPSDALNIWRVHYPSDNADYADFQSDVPGDWRVEGNMILANADKLHVEYIRRLDQQSDIALMSAGFIDTFSLRLAVELCNPIAQSSTLFASLSQEYEFRKTNSYAVNGSQAKHESFKSTQLTRVR